MYHLADRIVRCWKDFHIVSTRKLPRLPSKFSDNFQTSYTIERDCSHIDPFFLQILFCQGIPAYSIDGDNVRHGLNRNLGFTKEDREENVRRAAEVAKLFSDCGIITICSFVSPFEADRRSARRIHEDFNLRFFEIFVQASMQTCEARDVKGLYEKARKGMIKSFTGIGQDYEVPKHADLVLNTEVHDLETSTRLVIEFLRKKGVLPPTREKVEELFVEEKRIGEARREAESLPSAFFFLIFNQEGIK